MKLEIEMKRVDVFYVGCVSLVMKRQTQQFRQSFHMHCCSVSVSK